MIKALLQTFALLIAVATASTLKAAAPPSVTIDGLHRVPDTAVDLLYALPGATLSGYNRIYLAPVQISFVRDYKRRMNQLHPHSVTDQDMEDMKTALAELFTEEFTSVLQNDAGYPLVDGVADDVLAVRAAIIDLDVLAPEAASRPNSRSAIPSVGQMTLYLELIDSVSGDILAKALDHQYDRTRVQINVRNRDRNTRAARAIVRDWAEQLRQGMDEARRRTATP